MWLAASRVERLSRAIERTALDLKFTSTARFYSRAFPGRLRVEIAGVDPDGKLFQDWPLIDEDGGEGTLTPSARLVRWKRFLGAGGFGAALSFFVCCILPMNGATPLNRSRSGRS